MGKIKSSDKYDALSIMANLELNGLSKNDYISFVTDNRNLLNKVVEITDDNKDEIQDLTNSTIFKLFGTEIGEGFFKDSNKIILSFPDLKNQVLSEMDHGYTDEMQDIKAKAIDDGTFMKAPNGNPTNLDERQWLQVRTEAFKEWFGDWVKHAIIYNELKDIQNEQSRTNAERLSIQRMDMAKLSKSEKILKDAISIFKGGNDSSDRKAEQGVGRKE